MSDRDGGHTDGGVAKQRETGSRSGGFGGLAGRLFRTVGTQVELFVHNYGRYLGKTIVGAIILFLWAPIFVLSFMSFSQREVLSFPPESLTVDWYISFINNPQALEALTTTIQVAVIATPLGIFLSLLIAYSVSRYDFRGRFLLQAVATLPLIIPLIVVGVAMTMFFGFVGIQSGFWPVVFAHTVQIVPFGTLIILATLISFDTTLEEASMDLGANEFETFRQVTLPAILPSIIAATLLGFVISFNEFIYTYFVKDARTNTLPTYIWDRLQHTATPEVNVISVVFLLVAIMMVVVAVAITTVERVAIRQ